MPGSQLRNGVKIPARATRQERLIALAVFCSIAALFGGLYSAQRLGYDVGQVFSPCGFEQRYNLPCPTCWMTRSVLAFSRGEILRSYYMQPAGGLLCTVTALAGVIGGVIAVSGRKFAFLGRLGREVTVKQMILFVLLVLAGGWLVTLARALAARP